LKCEKLEQCLEDILIKVSPELVILCLCWWYENAFSVLGFSSVSSSSIGQYFWLWSN